MLGVKPKKKNKHKKNTAGWDTSELEKMLEDMDHLMMFDWSSSEGGSKNTTPNTSPGIAPCKSKPLLPGLLLPPDNKVNSDMTSSHMNDTDVDQSVDNKSKSKRNKHLKNKQKVVTFSDVSQAIMGGTNQDKAENDLEEEFEEIAQESMGAPLDVKVKKFTL